MNIKYFLISLALIISLIIGAVIWGKGFIDRQAPTIRILQVPKALGKHPQKIEIEFQDLDSGLAGYSLRYEYRNKINDLYRTNLNGEKSFQASLKVDLQDLKIDKGLINFMIRVYDRSVFSNSAIQELRLGVDIDSPKISSISAQNNISPDGVEPIFFEVKEENLKLAGVTQGDDFYQAFPGRLIDRKLRNPNLFVAFFSIDPNNPAQPKLLAIDHSDNKTSVSFPFYLMGRKFGKQKIKNPPLGTFIDFLEDLNERKQTWEETRYDEIKNLLVNPKTDTINFPSTPFLQPNGVVKFAHGDQLEFYRDQHLFHDTKFSGFYYLAPDDQLIVALQKGEVVYSEVLPNRGRTIIIAHGLGVFSIFSQIGESIVKTGQNVEQGEEIGLAGKSGQTNYTGYSLEIILTQQQANPLNWWDQSWFESHVTKKVREVKLFYNLPLD